ncbi:MAG: biotin--[Synergistaceae bacterium]|nr:biotin--[acetyl-CoA-carboxylase] ligase [Synergistaceae bacterium]MBQ3398813.1 biotin--[acetyl-CoA-carboxylase] ligase [Synergistaceae bacterium]MBQ3758597.1 biotin--[acetyl-CoA-carboxylase] ligase [Synergistaceae bacterium]MBQ4401887.1 biotin--[acetyl-CoA-carboxylase] ligase [Synergistaceae bacterium]MBQ6114090.1 biotin--[acetyl-CoA-carboxylase] ligase [Synergistaceae bacterium]
MKTKILNALETQRGRYVSGEELADSLGVTRAAVWKSIESLRKEGHRIKATTNKGYMLESESDVLTAKGISSHLKEGSKVSRVICLGEVDSTNNYAKKLAMNGEPHGTLIAANRQTAGRGRRGHSFESPAGTGLYMSLILRPETEAGKFQMITVADAVAVCLAVEELYPEARGNIGIKWVNDVYFRGKKICGILTEAVTGFESGEIESVITGIGINVSTKKFGAETSEIAGAIFADDEIRFGRDELCARVADYVMEFAEDLDNPAIIQVYRERSILTGREISYMKGERKCFGHVEGIDDKGGLIVRNDEGINETLRSGEVFMVRAMEARS